MGQSIQEWTKLNLQGTAFEKLEGIWSAKAAFAGFQRKDNKVTQGRQVAAKISDVTHKKYFYVYNSVTNFLFSIYSLEKGLDD